MTTRTLIDHKGKVKVKFCRLWINSKKGTIVISSHDRIVTQNVHYFQLLLFVESSRWRRIRMQYLISNKLTNKNLLKQGKFWEISCFSNWQSLPNLTSQRPWRVSFIREVYEFRLHFLPRQSTESSIWITAKWGQFMLIKFNTFLK